MKAEWISVDERLPETKKVDGIYWEESDQVAVEIDGFIGWTTGRLIKSNDYQAWQVTGWSGEPKVNRWYYVPQPPKGDSDDE